MTFPVDEDIVHRLPVGPRAVDAPMGDGPDSRRAGPSYVAGMTTTATAAAPTRTASSEAFARRLWPVIDVRARVERAAAREGASHGRRSA